MKNMNTMTLLAAGTCAMIAASAANAAVYYSTNFGTGYVNGNLAGVAATANSEGQNGWKQISTTNTNPVQVTNGAAILGTSGQDVWHSLSSSVPVTAGTTVYVSVSLRLTAAQTGDYFLGLDSSSGGGNYAGRVFAKSSGTGFVLGITGASTTATYGSTVLDFNRTYNVVYAWDFVSGLLNDTFSMYIDPTSTTRANLTSYVNATWNTGTEPTNPLISIDLRQGTSSSAPSVSVYSLNVGDSLASVGVPAPGAIALLGVAGLVGSRRRR